jgi:hypothetical protein
MPQRAALHTGGGDGTVVVVGIVVVVDATVGGVSCWLTGGDACSFGPQAARTAGNTRLTRATRRRVRMLVMALLDLATTTLLLLEPRFNALAGGKMALTGTLAASRASKERVGTSDRRDRLVAAEKECR